MGMAAEPEFHVLAVDDSLIDRKLIERLLKKSSYQVTTVDSGYKALEFLGLVEDEQPSVCPHNHQEVEVNLIITDYCMPGMTGYDLLKKVKESSAFRHIPVVMMSSENVPSRITRCLEEGAEEFFLKPVRLPDVNRLRPHMLRAKYGQQKQDLLQEFQKLDPKSEEQQQQQPLQRPLQQEELQQTEQQQPLQRPLQQEELQQTEQQPLQRPLQEEELQQTKQQPLQKEELQQEQQQNNDNKRKSMDEGLSTDRTRPRYNDLTAMV